MNRRFIRPGTLADGALVCEILAAATRGDPWLRGLLLADESSYAHAGHPYLGYLLRRLPAGLERCRIVPVAALLAPSPDAAAGAPRPLVIEDLASWALGGDLPGLLGAYLRVLFEVHVRLFARYGIALEAHQQNTALVLGPPGQEAPPRLLVKDFDSALIHLPRLASALGPATPDEAAFADPRMITRSDDALADMFITIVVHLCAGALAFGLADRNAAPLPGLLALVRRKLAAALDSQAGWPAAAVLRSRVLDADRLPGKSMVTAGTLVAKSRTGASDINKFYGTDGPNYLKEPPESPR
jgi:siderophore synthetase component